MFESLLSVLKVYDDTLPPGPQELVAGDIFSGFYGEFVDGLPGPTAFSNLAGVTEGSVLPAAGGWLKIADNRRLVYIAKYQLRNNVKWSELDAHGLVFGKEIQIGRHKFICKIMTGMEGTAAGGEWNRWMYPLGSTRPAGSLPIWANYTNAQLGITSAAGQGGANWVQEEASGGYHRARGSGTIHGVTTEVKDSTIANYGWRPVLIWVDPNAPLPDSGPGPTVIVNGSVELGYYGRVDTALIGSNIEVSEACGMGSTGIVLADTPNWLKFAYRGRILYIPQKPLRHTMRWMDLNSAGVTNNGKEIVINGYKYRVRLMWIAPKESANADGTAADREWKDLLTNVHGTQTGSLKWDTFTNADLVVGSGQGRYCWGQETGTTSGGLAGRVGVGYTNMTTMNVNTENNAAADHMGWRPVLDLIGKA